jgi:hypothetical protein
VKIKTVLFIFCAINSVMFAGAIVKCMLEGIWFGAIASALLAFIMARDAWTLRPGRDQCKCTKQRRIGRGCGDRIVKMTYDHPAAPDHRVIVSEETLKFKCMHCGRIHLHKAPVFQVERNLQS